MQDCINTTHHGCLPRFFLNLDGAFERLALLLRASNGLLTHDTAAPVTFRLFVFVRIAFLDGGD